MNENWDEWETWAGLVIALILAGTVLYLAISNVT